MKIRALAISTFLLSGLFMTSQITIDSYERQPKVHVDDLESFESVKAKSTCGEVQVKMTEQMFSGGCLGNLVRTYVFTDDCGNEDRAEQYLVLQDDVAPVFTSIPKDVLAYANAIPEKEEIAVEDNSEGRIQIDFSEKADDQQIIRTWSATDQCGNEAIATQIITIQDPVVSDDH